MIKNIDDYTIRPAAAGDEAFLREMLFQAIHVPKGSSRPDRSILQEPSMAHYVVDWGKRRGDQGLIAVDLKRRESIGAVWMRLFSNDDPGWGFVDVDTPELSISVLPDFRGRGIGRALLCELIENGKKDYAALSLSVDPENRAMKLYRRLGFEVVGASGTSLTMLKKLE